MYDSCYCSMIKITVNANIFVLIFFAIIPSLHAYELEVSPIGFLGSFESEPEKRSFLLQDIKHNHTLYVIKGNLLLEYGPAKPGHIFALVYYNLLQADAPLGSVRVVIRFLTTTGECYYIAQNILKDSIITSDKNREGISIIDAVNGRHFQRGSEFFDPGQEVTFQDLSDLGWGHLLKKYFKIKSNSKCTIS